jgi:hypothetical protein
MESSDEIERLESERERLERTLADLRDERLDYLRQSARGAIESDEELDTLLADVRGRTDNARLLLENVEVALASRRERRELAESATAWLVSLRERLSEVEEDTEEAFLARRQLVKLLVANITVGRYADGKPHVQVTYRFGPPQVTEVGPEGMYVGCVPNDKAFEVSMPGGDSHTFDSFECAIHALALTCEYCGVKVIGHGVEADGRFFCCAHCASRGRRGHGPRLSWSEAPPPGLLRTHGERGWAALLAIINTHLFPTGVKKAEACCRPGRL